MSHLAAPEYDQSTERRHGLWGLAVLVMIAVIVVAFIILFTGGKNGSSGSAGQDDSTLSGALPSGHHSSSHAPQQTSSAGVSQTSVATPPCQSSTACPFNGDVSGVAAGINELRIKQGVSPVPASTSANAQQCAAAHGSGSHCVPHFMYAGLNTNDAAAAVKALENVNASWLLDPTIKRIEIGWAREPGGRYDCAVLKYT